MDTKTCENCERNDGSLYSKYFTDEDGDGHWVCWECECEMEEEYYHQREVD